MVAPRKLPETGVYQPKPPSGRGGQMVNRNRGGPWAALGLGGEAAPPPLSMFASFLEQLLQGAIGGPVLRRPGEGPMTPEEGLSQGLMRGPLTQDPSQMTSPEQALGVGLTMAGGGMPPLELPAAQLQAEARARRGEPMLPQMPGGLMPESLTRQPGMGMPGMPPRGWNPGRAAYDMLPGPDMIINEPTTGYGRRSRRWG